VRHRFAHQRVIFDYQDFRHGWLRKTAEATLLMIVREARRSMREA
jgi:hypothetical protein